MAVQQTWYNFYSKMAQNYILLHLRLTLYFVIALKIIDFMLPDHFDLLHLQPMVIRPSIKDIYSMKYNIFEMYINFINKQIRQGIISGSNVGSWVKLGIIFALGGTLLLNHNL